jgi:hypothetical protein
MLKKSDKILLKKEENGKVLELWYNLNAKTELLKLLYIQHLQL